MKEITAVNLRCPQATIAKLDTFSGKMGISRNQLMCNLLSLGCDDLVILNRLGLLDAHAGLRNLIEKVRTPGDAAKLLQPK